MSTSLLPHEVNFHFPYACCTRRPVARSSAKTPNAIAVPPWMGTIVTFWMLAYVGSSAIGGMSGLLSLPPRTEFGMLTDSRAVSMNPAKPVPSKGLSMRSLVGFVFFDMPGYFTPKLCLSNPSVASHLTTSFEPVTRMPWTFCKDRCFATR